MCSQVRMLKFLEPSRDKSVWRKKYCSWLPLNKYAMNENRKTSPCSPRARIPGGRMEQIMQPWSSCYVLFRHFASFLNICEKFELKTLPSWDIYPPTCLLTKPERKQQSLSQETIFLFRVSTPLFFFSVVLLQHRHSVMRKNMVLWLLIRWSFSLGGSHTKNGVNNVWKHRKNCKCCPGKYLIVNHYSSMSWFKFHNLSVIVNCVTKSLSH